MVRLHLSPAFAAVPLSKLSPQQVRQFLNSKLASGLSTRRIQYLHAVLRAALNAALKDSLVARNVASLAKPPRVVAKEVKPLTQIQARKLLESVQGHHLKALFTVAISIGLCQGEALGLRWQDIDLGAGTLRVRYALQRLKIPSNDAETDGSAKKEAFHLVEPKTKQSRRTIALPAVTRLALSEHKTRQSEERQLASTAWKTPMLRVEGETVPIDDLVFVNTKGQPYDASTITHRFQDLLKLSGIARHRFHDLRHTAATYLAIQCVLGWDNIAMLKQHTFR